VDPVPDPLLLRKSGSAGDRTQDLCICSQKLWPLDHRGGQWCKMNAFFQIIVTFFIFNIKNFVNTKTTCNECSFDYLHWLLNYGKLCPEDGVLLAVHTFGASPQSSASHLLAFLVAQLQISSRMETFQIVDCTKFSNVDFLIWGNPKETNRRQIQRHAFFFAPLCTCEIMCVLKKVA